MAALDSMGGLLQVQQTLERLRILTASGLMSEGEYQSKRASLLDQFVSTGAISPSGAGVGVSQMVASPPLPAQQHVRRGLTAPVPKIPHVPVPQQPQASRAASTTTGSALKVHNIAEDVSHGAIKQLFDAYGTIHNINQKGYITYVNFLEPEAAARGKQALDDEQLEVNGVTLTGTILVKTEQKQKGYRHQAPTPAPATIPQHAPSIMVGSVPAVAQHQHVHGLRAPVPQPPHHYHMHQHPHLKRAAYGSVGTGQTPDAKRAKNAPNTENYKEPSKGVVLLGLPPTTTDAGLQASVCDLHGFVGVHLARDKDSKQFRGFAFVNFDCEENASAAKVAMTDLAEQNYFGAPNVKVQYANKKKNE